MSDELNHLFPLCATDSCPNSRHWIACMDMAVYMPILKWKGGEWSALEHVASSADRSLMIPMLELVEDSIDLDEELSAPTPFERSIKKPLKCWNHSPFYIDAAEWDDPTPPTPHPVELLFDACRQGGISPLPVIRLGSNAAFSAAVASIVATDQRGYALRLTLQDLVDPNFGNALAAMLAAISVGVSAVDLVLDWGPIESGWSAQTYAAIAAILPTIPHLPSWRSVAFAAGSFPSSLTGVGISTITRAEWSAYQLLLANTPGGRPLAFADYAIVHPSYAPAPFLPSAAIRYTTTNDWMIVRGQSLKGPVYGGFSQYRALCSTLMGQSAYCGASYSWGDQYISDCASGQVGTGNLTTWRAVGTNHHVTFAGRQCATYRVPSTGIAPPRVGP